MLPTYASGEQIFAEKLSLRFGTPSRGDIVVFRLPENKSAFAIKRVIGTPGDQVGLENGEITINGSLTPEPYLAATTQTWGSTFLKDSETLTVPENSYFLLGDNRTVSLDSRTWGFIPEKDLIGKPVIVYSPASSFRLL